MGNSDINFFLWDDVEDENSDPMYGEWIRASSIKRMSWAVQEKRIRDRERIELFRGVMVMIIGRRKKQMGIIFEDRVIYKRLFFI